MPDFPPIKLLLLPPIQADLPENKAKIVHPELVRFKLEKQAR
jgi:hypothetical protein